MHEQVSCPAKQARGAAAGGCTLSRVGTFLYSAMKVRRTSCASDMLPGCYKMRLQGDGRSAGGLAQPHPRSGRYAAGPCFCTLVSQGMCSCLHQHLKTGFASARVITMFEAVPGSSAGATGSMFGRTCSRYCIEHDDTQASGCSTWPPGGPCFVKPASRACIILVPPLTSTLTALDRTETFVE